MAKQKPVKRYKKGGSSDKQGSRDRANEDKVIAEKNAAAGFGGGGGDGGGKQGSIGSPQEVAAAIAAKGGDGGGGGGRATSRDSGGGGGGKGQPAAAETAQQAQVAAALATPGVQQGIAGLLGVPAQGGGRGAQQSGDLAFRGQDAGKELFAQAPVTGPAMYDVNGNVVGQYNGEPVPGAIGQTERVYIEDPAFYANPLPPMGQTPMTYIEDPNYWNNPLPPPRTPPETPVMSGPSLQSQIGIPDYGANPFNDVSLSPEGPLVRSNFRPVLGQNQIGTLPTGDFGIPVGPGDFAPPDAMTQAPSKPQSPALDSGMQIPGVDTAPLRQFSELFDQVLPPVPSFDASVLSNPPAPPSAPPPSAPPAAPVGVPTAAPAVAPSVVTAPPPGAGLTAEQIMADTANTAVGVPEGSRAPMGGGVLAAGANMLNPLTPGQPFPGGLFGGRPIFGEGGFLPADSRSGMSAAEIAAEIGAQGGSDDPVPALEPAAPAVDPNVMPSDKPAWWPSYLPWPPAPGSPYTPTPRPMPEPVPFTQYGTSYGPLTGAISGAQNPLMMGIGGMVRRR